MKKTKIGNNYDNAKLVLFLFISISLFIILTNLVKAQPAPHNVEGRVLTNGSNGIQNGIPVTINDTVSGDYVLTYTDAPEDIPELRGSYSATINGNDGDLIIVRAWNSTHYGTNSSTLISTTTNVNVVLNITRQSEANATIIEPLNNSMRNRSVIFNVTANISIIGNDGVGCSAAISFSNNNIINITAGESFSHSLGNIPLGTFKITNWSAVGVNEGVSNITVKADCSSDGVKLDNVNSYTVFNITIVGGPLVNSSINNTNPEFGEIINFSANISDISGLSFCQFIDNQSSNGGKRYFNITLSGQNDKCSQNYTIFRTRGNVINFSLIANDTDNNKNQTDFIITVGGRAPQWQNPQINDTHVEQFDFVKFNATWTDNIQLSGYIFSINTTGIWLNLSNVSFSGTANESNFTMQINASPNSVIGWVFYANDTSNNFNVTDVQTFVVASQYHIFYGNISAEIILDASGNLSILAWFDSLNVRGNIYVTDADTLNGISWASLQAIGKDKSLNDIADDWEDIDILLDTIQFSDSINRTFTNGTSGTPKNKTDFLVQGSLIANVSTINSTNSSNFVTGILWDTSDSADAQYDTAEKEDLIFITKVSGKALGSYGTYHYEIKVPARLKQYRVPNNEDSVLIYVELT